jgi:hypothetical protein
MTRVAVRKLALLHSNTKNAGTHSVGPLADKSVKDPMARQSRGEMQLWHAPRVKELNMFHGSAPLDCWSYAYRLRQRVDGGSFLAAVFVSTLLYVTGFAMAGDAPIPIIEVKLTEFTVELPKTVPVGKVIFSVTNAGTMEHNFEVEGQGIEQKFDTNLQPGETRNLHLDLPVGKYTVYCPQNDHRKRGMQLDLVVAEQQSHSIVPSTIFRGLP